MAQSHRNTHALALAYLHTHRQTDPLMKLPIFPSAQLVSLKVL